MDLLQNPFHILAATTRDNRHRITELADDRSLLLDHDACMRALSDLTIPRKRLSAEIAWLPGIGPKRAVEMLKVIESSASDIRGLNNLPPIAQANLLAAVLSRETECVSEQVSDWILKLAWAYEEIDPIELCAIINEERIVAGFPAVTDMSVVKQEIQERRQHYRKTIKSALDKLPSKQLVEVVTMVVDIATDRGKEHGPRLIDDLVDIYEVEAQPFLEKEKSNIEVLVKTINAVARDGQPDSTIDSMVNLLIQVVRNWDSVAQPIQLNSNSRGLDHLMSINVAILVRGLALDLNNEYNKFHLSQLLTEMLQEVFAEVIKVSERIAEDVIALNKISEEIKRLAEESKKETEKWQKELAFEARVGSFYKNKLCISHEGIEWKGSLWDLNSISRIRWGLTRHSVNGIPTHTTYKIVFGNNTGLSFVELDDETVFNLFVDRLWRAVGTRLLVEFVVSLRDGNRYNFGSIMLSDYGIEFEIKKLFSSNERVFCKWSELTTWSEAGFFCIGKKGNKKLKASFSYQDQDNIHVLETALSLFSKNPGERLSNLVEK